MAMVIDQWSLILFAMETCVSIRRSSSFPRYASVYSNYNAI
jgi:hypothetical protein